VLVAGLFDDTPDDGVPVEIDADAVGSWTVTIGDVSDPVTLRDLIIVVRYTEGA